MMSLPPVLLLHISTATIGLLSGFLAMALRKGSGLHRAAGTVFFGSMLAMSSSGAYIALFMSPNMANAVVASLTFYLVSTAWWAARRGDGGTGRFDVGAFLFILFVGSAGIRFGIEAANSPTGTKDHMPAAIYFLFGTIALLCALTDFRMIRRRNLSGARRLARHLWRMCLALLIATMSFYPGQAKLFPASMRSGFLFVPHILLFGSMIFWMYRMRARKRAKPIFTSEGDPMKSNAKANTKVAAALLICLVVPGAVIVADESPLTGHSKHLYGGTKKILLRAAENMPEEHYSYKPTEVVRTFGQLVGHVADSQYLFCSRIRGEKNPGLNIEKTKTTKADLIAALNDAFVYCEKAYEGLTDVTAAELVPMSGREVPKLGLLTINTVHTIEHYGNMVTYMRMKNLVPPTSDPEFMKQLR